MTIIDSEFEKLKKQYDKTRFEMMVSAALTGLLSRDDYNPEEAFDRAVQIAKKLIKKLDDEQH